jgi:hypothetical protein
VASLEARLAAIRAEQDPNRKNLGVAEIVSELFRKNGVDPVIVGGSAVEFYTDGTYVSGDVDVCFTGPHLPSPRERESILADIGVSLGARTWQVADVLVDLLGAVETSAQTPFQTIGALKLIQIEDLIAERILIATVPQFDQERWNVAKALLSVALEGLVEYDRAELEGVANSPAYRVGAELRRLIDEIEQKPQNRL